LLIAARAADRSWLLIAARWYWLLVPTVVLELERALARSTWTMS